VHDFSGEVQKFSGEVPAGMIDSFQFSPNVTVVHVLSHPYFISEKAIKKLVHITKF
jgi:hypothetical protein